MNEVKTQGALMDLSSVTIWDTRFGKGGSKRQIALPMVASQRKLLVLLFVFPMLFIASLTLLALILFVSAGFPILLHDPSLPNLLTNAALLFMALGLLCLLFWYSCAFHDLWLPRPLVSISASGIFDLRVSRQEIPWSSIERIEGKLFHGRGLILHLKAGADPHIKRARWRDALRYGKPLPPNCAVAHLHVNFGPWFEPEAIVAVARQAGVPFVGNTNMPQDDVVS